MRSKLLSAQKSSFKLLLDSWQVLKQILEKFSNWIRCREDIKKTTFGASSKTLDKFQRFQDSKDFKLTSFKVRRKFKDSRQVVKISRFQRFHFKLHAILSSANGLYNVIHHNPPATNYKVHVKKVGLDLYLTNSNDVC